MKEVFDAYIENAFGEYKQAEFKFKQFEVNYLKHFPDEKNEPVLDIGIGNDQRRQAEVKMNHGKDTDQDEDAGKYLP